MPVQLDAAALDRMEVSTWRTDAGDLDVLIGLRSAAGERVSYDELEQRSVETTLGAVTIRLAELPDIIESKRFADREKNREALPELEELLREDQ